MDAKGKRDVCKKLAVASAKQPMKTLKEKKDVLMIRIVTARTERRNKRNIKAQKAGNQKG